MTTTTDEFHGYTPESSEEADFLRSYDPSKFPIITVTVDMAVFALAREESGWEDLVLLIRRKNFPYRDYWALPGGFIDPEETPVQAAVRELQEEAGLEVTPARVRFVQVLAAPHRDPRGRCLSFLYVTHVRRAETVYAGDDAVEARWFPLREALAMPLAFDHRQALAAAAGIGF